LTASKRVLSALVDPFDAATRQTSCFSGRAVVVGDGVVSTCEYSALKIALLIRESGI